MIPMSHLSFVQCEQLKFRPKKIDKMKVYHGVVAVEIVCVCVGGGGGEAGGAGRGGFMSCHTISLICLVLPSLIKPNIFNNLK